MPVRLKYFQKYANAGDQFSLAAARHFFGPEIIACDEAPQSEENLLLLGSILQLADTHSHVCGAGFISEDSRLSEAPRAIHCVRGPHTARLLAWQGISTPTALGDPGILAPEIFPAARPADIPVGIIPHYVDQSSSWIAQCRDNGVFVIDVLAPLEEFFANLQRCEVILSSSLHGIIFAHAYGKPALWISLSDRVIGNGFKFFDYYSSIGIPMEKTTRVAVAEEADPVALARMAAHGDHRPLRDGMLDALDRTRRSLKEEVLA